MVNKSYILGLVLIASLGVSCCSQKVVDTTQEVEGISKSDDEVVMNNDYTSGVITKTEQEGSCRWVIKLDDGRIFETDNLKDGFMKNNTRVFFKYRGLKKKSSCSNATPVSITEMNMAM